ncbi:adenosine deaminase 2-like [Epargyreus clarus]|uniref:adenosine deaminase 2-like n=1 Tax=Epargyreus clarus TaxID=520877 RepID=UPI003C3062C6
MWSVTVYFLIGVVSVLANDVKTIVDERNRLLKRELDMMIGSDIVLSDSEQKVNEMIMKLKINEMDFGFEHPQYFNYSKHFFEYKDEVKKSKLFKLIKQMPKGAVLHAHDTAILGPDYLLNLTYWDDLYVCFEEEDVHLLFAAETPDSACKTKWQLMRDARYSSGNVEKFDRELRQYFTIVIDNPQEVYSDINIIWTKFQKIFMTAGTMLTYMPVWEQYFYDSLKALRDDNVMYFEVRSVLPELYDLDGNVYNSVETAVAYKRALDKFMNDYPDFIGAKLIYAPLRRVDAKVIKDSIRVAREIKRKLPDFLAGFDLVGQEDLGEPIKDFLPELIEASNEIDYFFHAGETNWYGTSSDENLADAIALGTRRIGHAFAIIKHPVLMEEVKKRNIALEVNVVSNVVLKLVEDVRNHPLAFFLAQNMPVVISSDDPGLWEAEPLSHDFYVTFMGVASRHADLRMLKKLALNSLYYSTVSNKDKVIHEFDIRWTKFIDTIVKDQW